MEPTKVAIFEVSLICGSDTSGEGETGVAKFSENFLRKIVDFWPFIQKMSRISQFDEILICFFLIHICFDDMPLVF